MAYLIYFSAEFVFLVDLLSLDFFGQSLSYAHLDSITIATGAQVKKSDTLGLVGNTGNAKTTSPHLHFAIYTRSGAMTHCHL